MQRRLYRSEDDRMLTGVSGGMADYFDVDPTLMRLLWVLLAIFTGGIAIVAYLVMAVIVPIAAAPQIESHAAGADEDPAGGDEPAGDEPPDAEAPSRPEPEPATAGAAGSPPPSQPSAPVRPPRRSTRASAVVGFVLIVVGVLALLDSLGVLSQFDFWRLWPLILIAFGAVVMLRRR